MSTPETKASERLAFEHECLNSWHIGTGRSETYDRYDYGKTAFAWTVWQAATAAAEEKYLGVSGMPHKINCDQVIWLQNILERYRETCRIATVAASYADEAAKLAAIHEIVELFGLQWEDESAMRNAAYKFFPIRKDLINKVEPQS